MRGNVREMSGKIALNLESRENKKIKRKKDRRWIKRKQEYRISLENGKKK